MRAMSEEALLQANACRCLQDGRDFPWNKGGSFMGKKGVVYARIDMELKEQAEGVLKQLGLTPTAAISALYAQIARSKGLPLDLYLTKTPLCDGLLSEGELQKEIDKSYGEYEEGKTYSQEEVEQMLKKRYGL